MQLLDMSIGQFLHKRARQNAELEALVGPRRRLTYQQYDRITNQVAHFLLANGVKKGDRIAMLAEANIVFPLIYLGAAKIGAIMVPLNWRWTPDLMEYVIKEIEPKILFYDGSFANLAMSLSISKEILKICTSDQYDLHPELVYQISSFPNTAPSIEVSGEDPICITYTSGSTGKPKGVVITHNNMYAAGLNNTLVGPFHVATRVLMPPMVNHISGTCLLAFQSLAGFTAIFIPEWSPELLLETIEKEKVNFAFMVPPLLRLLLPFIYKSNYSLSSLKEIMTGTSPVPKKLVEDYHQLGFNVTIAYSSTENSGTITYWNSSMGLEYCNSVGRPFINEVAILDPETREELPIGEIGELALKGPTVFKEYWKDPEETKKVKYNDWLLTGDAAYIDEKGFIYIVDRYKDVIYFGGTGAIFPSKVEGVIRQLNEVEDVAVVGLHHETWGEIPCAFVVTKPESNLTREQIFAHVYAQLPKHNLADVIFLNELPRNAQGKVDKPLLKKMYTPQSINL